MPHLSVTRFGPDDQDAMRAALDLENAVRAAEASWQHPELPRHQEARLRHGWDGEPETPYLLTADRQPVGVGSVSLTERDNTHLAWLSVSVHPEQRRRGYGSALMERLLAEARSAGRTSVGIDGWESEGAVAFATDFGLERRSQEVMRRQHLADVDLALVQKLYDEAAAAAADYELVRIPGRTPEDMRADVVELAAAINDAPTDDLDIEDEVMSEERLAAYEDALEARGQRVLHLVARHRATRAPAGHTVVVVEDERPTLAHQHDTAVVRAHRGHRLGLLLKAAMVLWLAEDEPQVATVDTWNAESNDHMIRVNELLGYRVMGRVLEFQRSL